MAKHLREVLAGPAALAKRAAELVAREIEDATIMRGRASIAISGGNTPRMLFEALSLPPHGTEIPWAQVDVFFVDERCVPRDHVESNFGVANTILLSKVPARVHLIRGEDSPEIAAKAYESELAYVMGGRIPAFDLVLLGMGADGHTASLFPHSAALNVRDRLAVAITDRTPNRVSITVPVINNARKVAFLVSGADKAAMLAKVAAMEEPDEGIPASFIRPRSGPALWLVDRAAAGDQ